MRTRPPPPPRMSSRLPRRWRRRASNWAIRSLISSARSARLSNIATAATSLLIRHPEEAATRPSRRTTATDRAAHPSRLAPLAPQDDGSAILPRQPSLPRHHRHAAIFGADLFGGGREIQFGAALVGAAADDQKTVRAGNDIALAQRRIVLDLDRRETDLVLAVAGAAADELVAIAERVRQLRIGLAVFGGRVVDTAAGKHFGLARRAETVAARRTACIVRSGDREIAPVAGPHAKRLATAATVAGAPP